MKKKGFTLIELLAVIVILAIIALIATPIILNMIKNAKESAAISSTYGYIEAVENYQAMEEAKGNSSLEEGIYNVASNTNKTPKINELVKLKGKKPTNGTITISKGKNVSGATLCINGYIVRYINKVATIESSNCDELGIITEYSLDKEGWQEKRELTIRYPSGNYKYYYKVSGNAKIGEDVIEKEKAIETTKEVTITLLENQTVETWLEKESKIIGKDKYIEDKIDNVEIVEPVGTIKMGYPILTENGVESSVELEITSTQEGTSPYYSLDNGTTWVKYTKKTTVNKSKVKIKMIRDISKRESIIKDATTSTDTITDAIQPEAYDGDLETAMIYHDGYNDIEVGNSSTFNKYMLIDSSMWGSDINVKWYSWDYSGYTSYIEFLDASNTVLEEHKLSGGKTNEDTFNIPNNTTKIRYRMNKVSYPNQDINGKLYEIGVANIPKINYEDIYPTLTSSGVKTTTNVTINYFKTSVKKLYKINNGNWQDYKNNKIYLNLGDTLKAKGIDKNGKETKESEIKVILKSDVITKDAYDGDLETAMIYHDGYNDIEVGNSSTFNKYMLIDSSMWGSDINVKWYSWDYSGYTSYIEFLDASNTVLEEHKLFGGKTNEDTFNIPNNTTKIRYRMNKVSYATWDTNGKLYEISIVKN